MTESEEKQKCIVDEIDSDLSLLCWWSGRYYKTKNGYVHSIVSERHLGIKPNGMVIDHIDRNPKNNKRKNLRYVTQAQNVRNSDGKNLTRKSKYRGVFKSRERWVAQITVNRKRVCLGTFDTELAAARAYKKAEKTLCGLAGKP